MKIKINILILIIGFLITITPLITHAKTYKNPLPTKDWAKYGLNPWNKDTDNDGYNDKEEIKQSFCPTNAEAVRLGSKDCKKGTYNLKTQTYTPPKGANFFSAREIKKFTSCKNLETILSAELKNNPNIFSRGVLSPSDLGIESPVATGLSTSVSPASLSTEFRGFSSTNIQVAGVDEGDVVKTDGTYLYNLTDEKLIISLAYPAENAEVLSRTILSSEVYNRQMYVAGDKLLIVGESYKRIPAKPGTTSFGDSSADPLFSTSINYNTKSIVVAEIWNIKDKRNPELIRKSEFNGSFVASRVTNGYAYIVLENYQRNYLLSNSEKIKSSEVLPAFADVKGSEAEKEISVSAFKNSVNCNNVQYIYPLHSNNYLQIIALPINNPNETIGEKTIWGMGSSDFIYVSLNNLYIISPMYSYKWTDPISERTEIYKFSLQKEKIELVGSQTVPGTILNEFSIDEFKGNVRLVTTEQKNGWWEESESSNLYILDSDLNKIGWKEGFGPDERIYSARFMGDRAYVVTFKETDPLFVFDLKNPSAPKLLGELSIPGYSNYIHPYDETHLIGIGKDAIVATTTPGFAWYQGMKIALFDVVNPNHPIELHKVIIGDRGTDSEALYDHHAFLFSKDKNLIALPIDLAELTSEEKVSSTSAGGWYYGRNTFQGLYAYDINLFSGFTLKGRVTHLQNTSSSTNFYDNLNEDDLVNRSLYINNNLYIFSHNKATIHDLTDLKLIKELTF